MQLGRLEQCLESCGESTSSLKDTAQSIIGNFLAMSHALADDEILKDLVTGVINTWNLVGSVGALFGTGYGRLLMVKVALFLMMLGSPRSTACNSRPD